MSVLNKKPYAQKVIESLGQADLESLASAINGRGTSIFRSYINLSAPFTESDKGAHHCVFESSNAIYTGYFCYNDYYCVLFAYDGTATQKMKIINIDYDEDSYEFVDEELLISEFRQIIKDASFKKIYVENIREMTDEQLNGLTCGDVVVKITDAGDNILRHAYVVTYKEDNVGICLTYSDAEYSETVSYDYTGGHWVYNSTDT